MCVGCHKLFILQHPARSHLLACTLTHKMTLALCHEARHGVSHGDATRTIASRDYRADTAD